jgi:hypothetical protein
MSKESYDPETDDGQGYLTQAKEALDQASDMQSKADGIASSKTGNAKAFSTYQQVARMRTRQAQAHQRAFREFRAKKNLKKAFE